MPTLRQPPPQPAPPEGSNSGVAAALAVAAPTAAASAGPAVGAGIAAGVLTVAAAQALKATVMRAVLGAASSRMASSEVYVEQVARERYPQVSTADVFDRLRAREQAFERVFMDKLRARLERDVPHALAISDPAEREIALRAIVEREKRYSQARDQAMLERALGELDAHLVRQLSPQGAYWKLSPNVMEHTLDCLAMGERFWPWSILESYHPPLHHGCPCYLLGLDEAVDEGLMRADQVPDPRDAEALFASLMDEVDQLGEAVSEADVAEWMGWPGRLGLQEAAVKHDGAMVALYPTSEVARALAVEGGEPAADIHLTLAFLGKASEVADPARLAKVVEGWAASTPPLVGEVSGSGKFVAGECPVVYASADVPGLPEARQRLVEALEGAGMGPSKEHGFTPHLTLVYEDRDVDVRARKLVFAEVALVLAMKRQTFRFAGELSEAREPLRFGRGLVKGGQFRPQRGSSAVAALRRVLGDGPVSLAKRGERHGEWRWVAGRYRRVPEGARLELRRQGRTYVSPAGSTNVYRDGVLVARGDVAERKASPGVAAPVAPDLHDTVEALRHQRRVEAADRARRAAGWRRDATPPVRIGDGPEAVLALRDVGFRLEAASKTSTGTRSDYSLADGGHLSVTTRKGVVEAVDWQPVPAEAQQVETSKGPPADWQAHVRDVHAWVNEMGERFGAKTLITDVQADRDVGDHAGFHFFDGKIRLGKDTVGDIDRAAAARAKGVALTDEQARGVWSTYWVSAHEGGHAVNPIDPMLWAEDAHANFEEALTEEASHVLATERLTEQGQVDVLEWRKRHPNAEAVRGGYLPGRHVLGELLTLANVTEDMQRRDVVMDLKFRLAPGARFDVLAGMLHEQHPERTREAWTRFVHEAMAVPGVHPDGGSWPGIRLGEYGGLKPSSYRRALKSAVFSPGREQVGQAGFARWPGGRLSEGGMVLTLPDGSQRRVEKLPLMDAPGLAGMTDGSAITHYPPGSEPTDGLTYADGTPKGFRYIDNARRGRLILRAFTGKGSAGSIRGLAVKQLERDIAELERELDAAEVWGDGDPAAIREQLVAARGDHARMASEAWGTLRRELVGKRSEGATTFRGAAQAWTNNMSAQIAYWMYHGQTWEGERGERVKALADELQRGLVEHRADAHAGAITSVQEKRYWDHLQAGDEVSAGSIMAFTSAPKGVNLSGGSVVQLTVPENKSGVGISQWSHFPTEGEVLVPKGTAWRVDAREGDEFTLSEIAKASKGTTVVPDIAAGKASKGTGPPDEPTMWDDFAEPAWLSKAEDKLKAASKWVMPWDKKDGGAKPAPRSKYKPPKKYVPVVPPPPIPRVFVGGDGDPPAAGQVIPTYDHVALEVEPQPGPGAWRAKDAQGQTFILNTHQGNQDHVAAEVLAAAVYRELGVAVPDVGTTGVKTPDFKSITDVKIPGGDPPIDAGYQSASTGIIVLEGDKVWIYEPRNHYGGYEHTFPKGGVEPGLTMQQNAHKELWEETGLHATITGRVGDFKGGTTMSRYYVGVRTGGEPTIGAETQAVKLVSFDEAEELLNKERDQDILAALRALKPPHIPGKKRKAELAKVDAFPAEVTERAVVRPGVVGKRGIKGASDVFAEGFAVDALLGNLNAADVAWVGDSPVRLSQDATLGYRSDGSTRTFGPVPTDLWQLKGPKGKAFGHVVLNDDQLRELAGDVADFLPDERIDALVGAAGFEPARAGEVAAVLKARRDWMGRFASGEEEIPGPMTGDEARGAFEDAQGHFKLLSPEAVALNGLIAAPWGAVNTHLRSGAPKDAASDEVRADVKALDGLFGAVPKSDEDAYVFSGLDMKPERAASADLGGLLGKTFKEKAFLPASFDMGAAGGLPAVLRVLVPADSRVASLGALGLDPAVNGEVVFPRGQEFRIVGRSEVDGKVVVDAVAIPKKQQSFSSGGYKPMKAYGEAAANPAQQKMPLFAEPKGLTIAQEQIDLHLRHMKPGGTLQLGSGVTVRRSKFGFLVSAPGGVMKAFGEAKADRYDAVRLAEKLTVQGKASPGTRELRAAVPGPPAFVTSNAAVKAENEKHATAMHELAVAGDLAGLKAYKAFSPKSGKLVKYKAALIMALDPSAAAPQPKSAVPKASAPAPSSKAVEAAKGRLAKLGVSTLPGSMSAANWALVVTQVADEAERLDKLWPGVMAGMQLVQAHPQPGSNGVYDLASKTIKLSPKVGHSSSLNKWGKPWSVTETGGDSAFAGVLRHELGHHVDYNSPPTPGLWAVHADTPAHDGPKKWRDALKATHFELDGKAVDTATWARANVSEYANTNTSEALAEMFCMFTAPNYVAGTLPAGVEAIMKGLAART